MEYILSQLLLLIGAYAAAGFLCALWLHGSGLRRVDPGVEGAGLFFRLLITPGLVALWPLLLARVRARKRGHDVLGGVHRPVEAGGLRRAHAWLAWALALLLPAAVAAAILSRPAPAASRVESPPGHPASLPSPSNRR